MLFKQKLIRQQNNITTAYSSVEIVFSIFGNFLFQTMVNFSFSFSKSQIKKKKKLTCQQKSFHEMKLIISATLTKIIKKGLKKKKKKEKKRREDAWHLFELAITRPMTSDGWFLQLLLFFLPFLELFLLLSSGFSLMHFKIIFANNVYKFFSFILKGAFWGPSFLTVSETLALPFANRTVILAWHLTSHKFFEFFVYVHSICFLHLERCCVGQFQTQQPKLPYIWELIARTSCWRSSQHLSRWRK